MTVLYVSFLKLNPQIWTIIIMVSYTIFMTSFSKVFSFHTFFPLGPPPYPEGNSNSASNFPSFPQSIFFLFFPFKPLPYPEGNFNFALYFPFFSLRFFPFLFCIWTSSLPLGRFQFSFLFYHRVFFPLEPSPSPASHSPSFHQSFFFFFIWTSTLSFGNSTFASSFPSDFFVFLHLNLPPNGGNFQLHFTFFHFPLRFIFPDPQMPWNYKWSFMERVELNTIDWIPFFKRVVEI